ncbi:hypothetical protein TRAPUB_8042 [Trametes pubescens]|uniref:Uncharacterized protein n=1 Tax=Trametes pubescens TaxID=154538 RepID=A0A1M2W6E5_TRAPU|nr:hypothetical protein TRAPUB_8042 [Trametes pubescens]
MPSSDDASSSSSVKSPRSSTSTRVTQSTPATSPDVGPGPLPAPLPPPLPPQAAQQIAFPQGPPPQAALPPVPLFHPPPPQAPLPPIPQPRVPPPQAGTGQYQTPGWGSYGNTAGPSNAGLYGAGPFNAQGPYSAGPSNAGPSNAGPSNANQYGAGPSNAGLYGAGPSNAGPSGHVYGGQGGAFDGQQYGGLSTNRQGSTGTSPTTSSPSVSGFSDFYDNPNLYTRGSQGPASARLDSGVLSPTTETTRGVLYGGAYPPNPDSGSRRVSAPAPHPSAPQYDNRPRSKSAVNPNQPPPRK